MVNNSVNINNKKAKYDYSLLDKYTCGIVLTGNEIKSITEKMNQKVRPI